MLNFGLASIAVRVHDLPAMLAFYASAFNVSFREVDTFGIQSYFAQLDGLTLKFVPIRETADFEGYPVHQLGFRVADIDAIMDLALQHGGRPEGDVLRGLHEIHAAVRDPDGNTIELYSTAETQGT